MRFPFAAAPPVERVGNSAVCGILLLLLAASCGWAEASPSLWLLARQPSGIFGMAWQLFGDSGIVLVRNALAAATLVPLFGSLCRLRLRNVPTLAVLLMALDPLLRQLHSIGEPLITLAFFAWYTTLLSYYLERENGRAAGLILILAMVWGLTDSMAWLGMIVHGITIGALACAGRRPVARPVATLGFILLAGWSVLWIPLVFRGSCPPTLRLCDLDQICQPMQRISSFGLSDFLPICASFVASFVPRSGSRDRSAPWLCLLVTVVVLIATGSSALVGVGVVSFGGRRIHRGMIAASGIVARQATARRLTLLARVTLIHWILTLMTVEPLYRCLVGIAPWQVGAYRGSVANPDTAVPLQALSVILREDLHGTLSTHSDWVPYLQWHLPNDLTVVPDLGGAPKEAPIAVTGLSGNRVDDRCADLVLVRCDSNWDQLLAASEGWCELYRDGLSTLYARDVPRLQRVISRASDQLLLPPPLPAAVRFPAAPIKFT